MDYYMVSRRPGEDRMWEKCKAQTLTGAKRECSWRYNVRYTDETLLIGSGDGQVEQRLLVCAKHGTSAWYDVL